MATKFRIHGDNPTLYDTREAAFQAFVADHSEHPEEPSLRFHRAICLQLDGTIERIIPGNISALHLVGDGELQTTLWEHVRDIEIENVEAWFYARISANIPPVQLLEYTRYEETVMSYKPRFIFSLLSLMETDADDPSRVVLVEFVHDI